MVSDIVGNCMHCLQPLALANPSGYCSHIHYPEACAICAAIPAKVLAAVTLEDALPVAVTPVVLTQYLRPSGQRRVVLTNVRADLARLKDAHMVMLSCEVLLDGTVVIYGRSPTDADEEEVVEFADNAPDSPRNPTAVVELVISRVLAEHGVEHERVTL